VSHSSPTCLISINSSFLYLLLFFFYYSDICKVVRHSPIPISRRSASASAAYAEQVAQISSYAYFCHFSLPSVVPFRSEPLGLDFVGVHTKVPSRLPSLLSAYRVCVEIHQKGSGLNSYTRVYLYCHGSLSDGSIEWTTRYLLRNTGVTTQRFHRHLGPV
jgi:hypothetical protein